MHVPCSLNPVNRRMERSVSHSVTAICVKHSSFASITQTRWHTLNPFAGRLFFSFTGRGNIISWRRAFLGWSINLFTSSSSWPWLILSCSRCGGGGGGGDDSSGGFWGYFLFVTSVCWACRGVCLSYFGLCFAFQFFGVNNVGYHYFFKVINLGKKILQISQFLNFIMTSWHPLGWSKSGYG